MDSFETQLRDHIKKNKMTLKARRLLNFLDAPRTKYRQNVLDKMKHHVLVSVGKGMQDPVGFDWSTIDWAKLFQQIFALIMALLPLFAVDAPAALAVKKK